MSKFKVLALALAARKCQREVVTREHRFWEHVIIKKRKEHGTYQARVQKMLNREAQTMKIIRLNRGAQTYFLVLHMRANRGACPGLAPSKSAPAYHHLVQELEDDDEQFQKYFRVNKEQLTKILNKISPLIEQSNKARETIGPNERLCICLR